MLERSIISGFGVPIAMIEKKLNDVDAAKVLVSLFSNDIRMEHRHVRSNLQKMVNKIALSMNLETVPEIQLFTPSDGEILAYCGYDITKDLKELQKLVDAKIISSAEFENIKRNWIGS